MDIKTGKVQGRRKLHFANYDQLLDEVHRLAAAPSRQLGNWSLGQICAHLAIAINDGIDGAKYRPPWFVRLIGPLVKHRLLTQPMRAGFTLPRNAASLLPPPTSTAEGVAELERAIARQKAVAQPARNVVFGPMTIDEWNQLHFRHAEMHLSFIDLA